MEAILKIGANWVIQLKIEICMFVWKVKMTKVKDALRRMKMRKFVGSNEIPIEVWKCLGDGVWWLTNIFYKILRVNKFLTSEGEAL
jgi:hypothetical protein